MNRRQFLKVSAALIVAPALVKAEKTIQVVPVERLGDKSIQMNTAKVMRLVPGEKIGFAIPNYPDPNFVEFERAILQGISSAYQIPEAYLTGSYRSAKYI